MNVRRVAAVTVCVLVLVSQAFAQPPQSAVPVPSAWTNQSGSTLYIEHGLTNGQIVGTYVNRAAGFSCQNTPYPVIGWIFGNAITFTVNWQNSVESCNSITAWTGFYTSSTPNTIQTLWQLVVNGSTSTGQILSGQDTFTQTAAQKKLKSLK